MTQQKLVSVNIKTLKEGVKLLQVLDSRQYKIGFAPAFEATIGAHFRHVIEHYRCLLSQLQTDIICYDVRERDAVLEDSRDYALESMAEIISLLRQIDPQHFERSYGLQDLQADGLVDTTLRRELLFLQSHTVHHYAIIAAMARGHGVQTEEGFGVAIATLNFERSKRNKEALIATEQDEGEQRRSPCAQ